MAFYFIFHTDIIQAHWGHLQVICRGMNSGARHAHNVISALTELAGINVGCEDSECGKRGIIGQNPLMTSVKSHLAHGLGVTVTRRLV